MKKIIKVIVEIVITIFIFYLMWNKDISVGDNLAIMSPFIFIYGLMYLILRG